MTEWQLAWLFVKRQRQIQLITEAVLHFPTVHVTAYWILGMRGQVGSHSLEEN